MRRQKQTTNQSGPGAQPSPRLAVFLMALAMLLLTPACALVQLVVPLPTPTPVPQRALRPTFTPTPVPLVPVQDQPAQDEVPAAEQPPTPELAPPPAVEPAAPPQEAPTEAPPPEPTPEPATPTPTVAPFVVVDGDLVRARAGPGTNYDQVGELRQGQELAIVARNEDGSWWQVCCLDGQQLWVVGDLVSARGTTDAVAVAANIPPSPTPTETPIPVPRAVVRNPLVNVRSGPGTAFDLVGQAQQGTQLEIVGRDQASEWWQVCCVDGQRGWITGELVNTEGPVEQVALAADLPTPTPLPTKTPAVVAAAPLSTPTPEPDPSELPFELTETETFPLGDGDYFRVGIKVSDDSDSPLGDTYLRIVNETTGQQWLSRESGDRAWEYSAPSADFDDFREINIQFDTNGKSALSGNTYSVWLIDGSGARVSPTVQYAQGDDEFLWLYVVFVRK